MPAASAFESAFNVLAVARQLKAAGKRVIELKSAIARSLRRPSAKQAGIPAIAAKPEPLLRSAGLPELRAAASDYVNREHALQTTAANVVIGPGAKPFELFFCEAFLDPGDGVLVFSPYFPTYLPNILRRGARPCLAALRQEHDFRPDLSDVERFFAKTRTREPSSSIVRTIRPAAWRRSKIWRPGRSGARPRRGRLQ